MLDLRPIPTEAYVIPSYRTFQSHGQCPVADRPDKRDASVPPTCQHSSMVFAGRYICHADTPVHRQLARVGMAAVAEHPEHEDGGTAVLLANR